MVSDPADRGKGVVSYSTGFRQPGAKWSIFRATEPAGDVSILEAAQTRLRLSSRPRLPAKQSLDLLRLGQGGHDDRGPQPLLSLCEQLLQLYRAGCDGVWPNLAWDLAVAGRRTAVDTVEYLYTSDMAQPLPQRFINARFETYGDVSRRMGVQSELGRWPSTIRFFR